MDTLVFTQLSIPEVRQILREEIESFFENKSFPPTQNQDDIGKGAEYASRITGKAIPTIYDLVHKRLIPHSKRGKDLYFSRSDLEKWIRSGKRITQAEAKELAAAA